MTGFQNNDSPSLKCWDRSLVWVGVRVCWSHEECNTDICRWTRVSWEPRPYGVSQRALGWLMSAPGERADWRIWRHLTEFQSKEQSWVGLLETRKWPESESAHFTFKSLISASLYSFSFFRSLRAQFSKLTPGMTWWWSAPKACWLFMRK